MTQNTSPQLSPDLYQYVLDTFRRALPPPLNRNPEDLQAAIDTVAGMHPATITEADQAAMFVVFTEQWKHCLRQAVQPGTPLKLAYKWRAQALAMMRTSQNAFRMLLTLQNARQKIEADPQARARAEAERQRALELLTQALQQQPRTAAHAPPKPAPQPAAAPDKAAQPPRFALIQGSVSVSKVTIH